MRELEDAIYAKRFLERAVRGESKLNVLGAWNSFDIVFGHLRMAVNELEARYRREMEGK